MLYLNSLGKFQLSNQNSCINDDTIRSDKLTKLLMYLILYRWQNPSLEELIGALWHENETDNPTGALKNLVYRLRTVLKKQLGDRKYIMTSGGSYHWNPKIEVSVDVEQMERIYQDARWEKETNEKIQKYEKIVSLYKGDFMPKVADMHWIITLSAYYHSIFLNSIKTLAGLYWKEEMYQDLERITITGIQYDYLDEELYSYQIQSLMAQKKVKLASVTYEKARKVLYKELGMDHARELERIHDRVLQGPKNEKTVQMEQIKRNLSELETGGAFVCSYPVFQEIYHLETRRAGRQRQINKECLVLLTVTSIYQGERFVQELRQTMEQLEEAMRASLRVGDVVTRYSECQYLILLPDCDEAGSRKVSDRIKRFFMGNSFRHKKADIIVEVEEISNEGVKEEKC